MHDPKAEICVCINCVMDTTDKEIRFDADGVCDHCNHFYNHTIPNWSTGDQARVEREQLVERIRKSGQGQDFDCIIGMSGGIDSSYLLYVATEVLGLRPLVFHVDAGWNSDIAVNNIEKLVDGLRVDLFTEVIDWDEMRDLQLAFFRSGVPHIDTPQDHAFFATMYKFAAKYNVKHILTGANLSTECVRNPLEWMYFQSDARQLKAIHNKYGTRPLKTFPTTSILWHKIWLPYVRKIKTERPLNLVNYNKTDAINTLVEKFGFQPYPQKHFESRFTKFYEGYWLYERFGFDVRKVQFSSLILTGQMTRDEALQALQDLPYDAAKLDYEFEFIANKLDIGTDELKSYFMLPKRTFGDFANQSLIYNAGSRIMRLANLEVGGKR